MGVLVPGGDRTAVRRTAEFFLTSFQARPVPCAVGLFGGCCLAGKGTEVSKHGPGWSPCRAQPIQRAEYGTCVEAQERLATQHAEAAVNPEYGKTFKAQASKDDKKARRKQILSSIGAGPCCPVKVLRARNHEGLIV